jgi:TetR/AcrR family transcriptional regulator, transcriptional repressor of bet genes
MSRASEMQKRKLQIIDAAMDVLLEDGFCDLRLSRVAKHAGVSAGLVCHHYGTKQGLLLAVMRHAVSAYQSQSEKVIAANPVARDQIFAIVRLALVPEQSSARLSAVWLALYYLSSSDSTYRTELLRYQQQNYENILSALSPLYDAQKAQYKARVIAAMIDGVWLQNAVHCETVDLVAAQELAVSLAEHVLTVP